MTSGVPQGSVQGHTLLLIYVNDLPDHVNCKVSFFADDTLMYQTVNTVAEAQCFSPTSHLCLHGLTHGECLSMLQNAESCASIRNRLHLLLTTLLVKPNLKLCTRANI